MALTSTQIAQCLEIVGTSDRQNIQYRLGYLDAATETLLTADLATWQTTRNTVNTKVKGGVDGVDYDPMRLQAQIRGRVRLWLGYDTMNGTRTVRG